MGVELTLKVVANGQNLVTLGYICKDNYTDFVEVQLQSAT